MAHVREKGGFGAVGRFSDLARLFQARLVDHGRGDVQPQRDNVAPGAAPVDQLDVLVVPQPDRGGFRIGRHPAIRHHGPPIVVGHLACVHDALIGQHLKDGDVIHPRTDQLHAVEDRQIGAVGGQHLVGIVEKSEPVGHRFNRMPQPPLRDLDLVVGHAEVGFDAQVLVAHGRDLGAGLVDLVAQFLRVAVQLAPCCRQFRLLEFKQTFGRQPSAPFFRQFVGQRHGAPV